VRTAEQDARRASHRFGGLLWHRNFRLLWIGETVSGAGNSMAAVGVPLLAVAVLHASTFAVSALTAAAYLPWLVIGLPAGAWVDRLPSRPLMVSCDIVSALLYGSLPVAAWIGVLTTGQLLDRSLRPDSVRYMSVTTAMQRLTAAHHETQRDNSKTTSEPGYTQAMGRFRWWWQVLCPASGY
jgi:MFS family permease